MNYAFKIMAIVLALLIPPKLVLAKKFFLDCETIKKNVENIINSYSSCGLTKPQSCYDLQVESSPKYNSLAYQIYVKGNLSKSFFQELADMGNTFSKTLVSQSINTKTQTINYIFEDKSFSSKSMLAKNENCNFLDLFRGNTSVPLNASYNDEMDIDNIPKWCLNTPISEHSIFRCGIGNSKNKHIAKDIALLNARNEVYDSIGSIEDTDECGNPIYGFAIRQEISSLNQNNMYMERIIKGEFLRLKSLKTYTQLVNGVYAHFELLEYIVPPKKKYTKSEIKQCKINAEIDTNNAMKELEAEIKMRNK